MAGPWVALVGPEIEENLSLRYLSASLGRAGYPARIVRFSHEADLPRVLDELLREPRPRIVGLSLAFQWRAPEFLALAVALRERGYRGHITAGGHFGTFACAELLRDFPELDSICRQEAELTICELAHAVEAGTPIAEVRGVSFRDGDRVVHNAPAPLPDVARLPWPDRGTPPELFGHRMAPLVGSRGCYARCSFCCIAAWHEQSLPGRRYRLRPVEDVADEMLALHRERGVEIFVFQDDNFFLPRERQSLERLGALADALERRRMGRFCTIVKARPNDVHPGVFQLLRERLFCLRAYVGIETDSDQGLRTLGRAARPEHNREAIRVLRDVGLYATFNVLLFDPDTTLDSLEHNLGFMEQTADFPFNFGRTELYAGTPLLQRMLREGRAIGDYLHHTYEMSSPEVERAFQIARRAFERRNFADGAVVYAMMGLRFEVEAARFFHPDAYRPGWLEAAVALTRRLGLHSTSVLREIVRHVRTEQAGRVDDELARSLERDVGREDGALRAEVRGLAKEIHGALGDVGTPLTAQAEAPAGALLEAR